MPSEDLLAEKLDEIRRILRGFSWVKSYEVFLQNQVVHKVKRFEMEKQQHLVNNRSGTSLRILTSQNRLLEYKTNLSSIASLKDLSPPKSTVDPEPVDKFPSLTKPRIRAVVGDDARGIQSIDRSIDKMFSQIDGVQTSFDIPFFDSLSIEEETRFITNSGSPLLKEQSLKVQYGCNAKFQLDSKDYSLSRSISGRTFNIDFTSAIVELVNATETRIKLQRCKTHQDDPVILHPQVLGRILSYYMMQEVRKREMGQLINWQPSLKVYDDPLRKGGYNSSLFDDEGSLTRTQMLISDNEQVNRLSSLKSSNWVNRGNGYRSEWYQPSTRSYTYPITPNFSNLVLTGGTGKGAKFVERNGRVILVKQGYGYTDTQGRSLNFIIHANEVEIWQNGSLLGPADNTTIIGQIPAIFSFGHFSSDQFPAIDNLTPGSVYTGWLTLGPNIVNIR